MKKRKVVHIINTIIFFILVVFFGFYTITFGIGTIKSPGTNSLVSLIYLILVLFYSTTFYFYIKAFSLNNLNNNWFKISFKLNSLSLSVIISIFLIILILSQRVFERALFSFIEWGSDPGIVRIAIIGITWLICWFIFIISMVIFLVGYYKQKNKK